MRPFLTTLTVSALIAAALWWQQQRAIASLRKELPTPAISTAAAGAKEAAISSAKKKPAMPPRTLLRRADGSVVAPSRSMFRGALEMAEYIRRLSRTELEALIKSDGSEFGDDMLEPSLFALARLGELDPAAAIKLAGMLARTKNDSSGFSLVMHDWLIRDRAAALKWFHAQPDTNAKAGFLGVAGMVLGQSDPELLKQLNGSIEDPDLQQDGLKQSMIALVMSDPQGALGRLHELPNDQSRTEMLLQMIAFHGEKMPGELLDAAMPLTGENETTENKMLRGYSATLLSQLAATDPKAALAWITSRTQSEIDVFKNGSLKSPGLIGIGKLDTAEVLAAAKNLPAAQQDWLIANHYSGRPMDDAPALMAEAAEAIKDPANLKLAQNHLLLRAATKGQEAALEPWIATLPAKEQAEARAVISAAKKPR